MDKLKELRAQLNRLRNSSTDQKVRTDYFEADCQLELYEIFLSKSLDYRRTRMLMARHHTIADLPLLHDPPTPQLFRDNIQIKQLHLCINFHIIRTQLDDMLSKQDCDNYEIKLLKRSTTCTVAIINCNSLASSMKIQVKSCKKELFFQNSKG